MSPASVTSKAPRIARSMWPPRICANESSLEKRLSRAWFDGLFAGVDQVGVFFAGFGKWPMPNKPFSDCKVTCIPRNVVGHQCWNADPEIDVETVAQLCAARFAIISRTVYPAFATARRCTVRNSMRFSYFSPWICRRHKCRRVNHLDPVRRSRQVPRLRRPNFAQVAIID